MGRFCTSQTSRGWLSSLPTPTKPALHAHTGHRCGYVQFVCSEDSNDPDSAGLPVWTLPSIATP